MTMSLMLARLRCDVKQVWVKCVGEVCGFEANSYKRMYLDVSLIICVVVIFLSSTVQH